MGIPPKGMVKRLVVAVARLIAEQDQSSDLAPLGKVHVCPWAKFQDSIGIDGTNHVFPQISWVPNLWRTPPAWFFDLFRQPDVGRVDESKLSALTAVRTTLHDPWPELTGQL